MGLDDLKPKSYTSAKDATIGESGTPANIDSLARQLKKSDEAIKAERRELVSEL